MYARLCSEALLLLFVALAEACSAKMQFDAVSRTALHCMTKFKKLGEAASVLTATHLVLDAPERRDHTRHQLHAPAPHLSASDELVHHRGVPVLPGPLQRPLHLIIVLHHLHTHRVLHLGWLHHCREGSRILLSWILGSHHHSVWDRDVVTNQNSTSYS